MIARFTGAGLGLLAFTITVTAGVVVGNPIATTLSRSILALFVFCLVGLALGAAAQVVIADHVERRESQIRENYARKTADADPQNSQDGETENTDGPAV